MTPADTKLTTTNAHFGYDEILDRSYFQVIPDVSIVDALNRALHCLASAANLLQQQRLQPDNFLGIDAACFLIDAGEALVRSSWESLQEAGIYEEPVKE